MTWVLIMVAILNGDDVGASIEGIYGNLNECFDARDTIIIEQWQNYDGYPAVNYQLVCIRSDKYDTDIKIPKVDPNSIRG